jgi:hypothetical protein
MCVKEFELPIHMCVLCIVFLYVSQRFRIVFVCVCQRRHIAYSYVCPYYCLFIRESENSYLLCVCVKEFVLPVCMRVFSICIVFLYVCQ